MAETKIVWIRNPEDYPYVRVKKAYVPRKRGWADKWTPYNEVIIGYAEVDDKSDKTSRYERRIFVLHENDYPLGTDYNPNWSMRPTESVDPLTIAPNIDGEITERCWKDISKTLSCQ